ncbi:carbohydrate ABC transporter substrate-binding protein [Vibrio sp. HA2012]|uniref:ABC transporter substrate-binding protein n=1 Tax=Vibrio sp. HA2012 TaxID=1971595 RepID=UPI000C2C2AA4|nr:ABC transporter substrate-binding protein [Vibrio sp. HA2012]PJC87589.1 carbohydrate ABC transporter substrate-binding protein [Vibrio sp. HA2012]
MKSSLIIALLAISPACCGQNIEFLHWWTSTGEKSALKILEKQLSENQIQYHPSPVIGGGGDTALTVLQARALAGNSPNIAQIEGPVIKAWDAIGVLHSLNHIAEEQQWDKVLYPLAIQINKTDNGYVSMPLVLHRLNWLWVNHHLLKQINIPIPQNWEEMLSAMEKARDAGIIPLAVGARPWQIAQLFESIVIGTGGAEFYKATLVDLNPSKINSSQMRYVLKQFRRLSMVTEQPLQDISWDKATSLLIQDKALFQIGGDWVLGELISQNIQVPEHIGCYPAPPADGSYLYNMDSLIFLKSKNFSQKTVDKVARALSDKAFQAEFNKRKGSIPVRTDIDLTDFNLCQKQSFRDYAAARQYATAVPSMTDSMAINPVAQQAINSEIYRFYRDMQFKEEDLIKRIIAIAESN